MALDADPYRTLGLARGASREEVKRAYRALAKVHHPDAAGEKALPRFLAIQAAYEQLIDGSIAPRGRGSAAARKPWEADDDRSDATRRAYGARPRGPRPSPGAGPAGAGPAGARPAGGSPGGGRSPGAGGPRPGASAGGSPGGTRASGSRSGTGGTGSARDDAPGTPGARSAGGTRGTADPPNKATLGSTSYDGVDPGRFEPDWDDASWYGTSSGTYWTLNPKEYADPRKHGPEYQARARRSAQARAEAVAAASAATAAGAAADTPVGAAHDRAAAPPGAARDPAARDPATAPGVPNDTQGPSHTTTSWWDSTAGPAGTPPQPDPRPRPATPRPATPPRATRRPPTLRQALPVPDLGAAATQLGRALIDERTGGHRARIVRAVIGWLPITLGLGWFVGELSGCSRFAASCDGTTQPFLLALQVAALLVLVVVPFLASIASTAALTAFIVALMVSLVITATGSAAGGDSRQATLGVLMVIAWAFGLAFAIAGRVRALVGRAGPVS